MSTTRCGATKNNGERCLNSTSNPKRLCMCHTSYSGPLQQIQNAPKRNAPKQLKQYCRLFENQSECPPPNCSWRTKGIAKNMCVANSGRKRQNFNIPDNELINLSNKY